MEVIKRLRGISAGRFLLTIVCFAVMMALCTENVWGASNGRETEPNDSKASADKISVNTAYSGNISEYGDEDWYKFTTTANGTVEVSFNHSYIDSSSSYWRVHLKNADGETIVSMYVDGDEEKAVLTKVGLPAGTYYAVVTDSSYNDAAYTMKVTYTASSVWETEYNNNRTIADNIAVNKLYYGNIMDYNDEDWYKFTTTGNGTVQLSLNHPYIDSSSTYWRVYLKESDGDTIADMYVYGNKENAVLTKVGLPAGTYYAVVTGYYGDNDATYTLKAGYTASSVWETEYNNNRTIADSIAVNRSYYGNIMDDDDEDWYKFTTKGRGTVQLSLKHPYIDSSSTYWRVYLKESDGDTIADMYVYGNKENAVLTKVGLPAGTYYAVVTGYSHSDATYTVKAAYASSSAWETEYNDNRTIADAASLGKRYYGNLMDGDDEDYYRFKLSKKAKIKLNFQHGYINSTSTYWKVSILNKNEDVLDYAYVSGKQKNKTYNLGYMPAGTYYVLIQAYSHSDKNYSFKVYKENKPYATKVTSIKGAKRSVTLKWKKSSDATGYEIYRATKKNGKYEKIKTIKNKKTVKYTNKKLKKGKRYYYKVRSYRTVGGKKYYSSYSSVKSTKAK